MNYQPEPENWREKAGIRGAIVLAFCAVVLGLVCLLSIAGGL